MVRSPTTRSHSLALLSFVAGSILSAGGMVGCSESAPVEDSSSVVKLGFFARGGEGFSDGGNIALVLLALREINDAGGLTIDGAHYTLDLETASYTDSTAEEASEVFDELVASGVKAVLGPPWSSQVLDSVGNEDGVWRRAREHQTVVISESATSPLISDLDDDNYVFRMMPPDSVQGKIAAEEAYARGARTVSILRRNDVYGSGLAEKFIEEFEALGGLVAVEAKYDSSGETIQDLQEYDYTEELDEVFGAEPDLVYLLTFDELARISQRIAERGDVEALAAGDVQFLGGDGLYDLGILEGCFPVVTDRLIGTTPGVDKTSTAYREFDDALVADDLGPPWNASAQLYDAAYLIALAMQSADSFNPADFKDHISPVSRDDEGDVVIYLNDFARAREALLNDDGVNYEGASGPIELNGKGDPSAGTFLVWSVRSSEAEGISLVTEKVIPFDQ